MVLEWGGGDTPWQPPVFQGTCYGSNIKCPLQAMCCILVPQLVTLFWEVLESLGVRSICKKQVLEWGQALGAYPWCFLSHFLLPVIHGVNTFPLPQAPDTCQSVLP